MSKFLVLMAQETSQNAPFDKIIISASAPDIGTVYLLLDQLKDEGIIVAPVKNSLIQIKSSAKTSKN